MAHREEIALLKWVMHDSEFFYLQTLYCTSELDVEYSYSWRLVIY